MLYTNIRECLFKLSSSNRCPQSFIFHGKNIEEIEKISKEFSLRVLRLQIGNPHDILEFGMDKKSITVDDIRNINSEMIKMPHKAKNKVVIIYNADRMNVKAQNTFLKSLEDCVNVFIILIVKNISRIISTVLSRCLVVKFGMITIDEYKNYLNEFRSENDESLDKLYFQSGGDVDVSKSILGKRMLYKMYLHIIELLKGFFKLKLLDLFELGSQINSFKDDIEIFLNIFLSLLRDVNLYLEIKDIELIKNKFFKEEVVEICESISPSYVYFILKELHNFKIRVESNLNIEICYKNFILKIAEA